MPDVLKFTGSNLPREYYFSQSIFEQELQRVFSRQWLAVGHVSLVREPGSYYVKQVGPESLIITRGSDGKIRAFFNVCRHRGFRLCGSDEAGHARRFTCPYHGWTYQNDGALLAAPSAIDGKDFVFRDYGLHEAWCETFKGFIFVYLGREAPPSLDSVLAPQINQEAFSRFDPERLKLAHRESYVVNANWKALMENDTECAHCGIAHASLRIACDYQAFYADTRSGAHFPLRANMKTFSIDGDWVCSKPLAPNLPEQFSCGFILVPNFCGPVFFADHCVSLETTPLTVGSTKLICEWYVQEDAVKEVDYQTERLIEVFHITNLEDAALTERNYQGMSSMRFTPGPLSATREDGTRGAVREYLRMMSEQAGHTFSASSAAPNNEMQTS